VQEIDRLNPEEIDAAAVVLSHRTSSIIKIVDRGQSTLVDAYLGPVVARYLEGIKKVVGNIPIAFMQSSGVLTPPASFTGRNALFSGPAGGAIAVGRIAEERAIGFDMGGTSTDVSRYEGGHERIYEKEVGGVSLQTEMIDIVKVAAGGGSVLDFDGQRMTAAAGMEALRVDLKSATRFARDEKTEGGQPLEIDFSGGPGAGDDVAYVVHPGDVLDHSLEAETEPGVRS
jgi:N-methylhydantoinase A/oxoprolinase/acetone carboxylase beta subunit